MASSTSAKEEGVAKGGFLRVFPPRPAIHIASPTAPPIAEVLRAVCAAFLAFVIRTHTMSWRASKGSLEDKAGLQSTSATSAGNWTLVRGTRTWSS